MKKGKEYLLKTLMVLIPLGLASITFHVIFMMFTPYVISLIPMTGEWVRLVNLFIYIIIGWCGGIALTFLAGYIGIAISLLLYTITEG